MIESQRLLDLITIARNDVNRYTENRMAEGQLGLIARQYPGAKLPLLILELLTDLQQLRGTDITSSIDAVDLTTALDDERPLGVNEGTVADHPVPSYTSPIIVGSQPSSPIPIIRRFRTGDPRTSVEAARRTAKASLTALQAVERVMADGLPRIDEEIWRQCRATGYVSSLATVQHGRLALSEAGILKDVGTRNTSYGSPSRTWQIVQSTYSESR